MSNVLNAAKALNIDHFDDWEVPNYENDVYNAQRDLSSAVRGFVLQIRIRHSRNRKVYSASLDDATKARIHNLIGK